MAIARKQGWTRKQKRMLMIAAGGAVLVVAAGLILTALNDKIVFFYSPSDIQAQIVKPGSRVRIGGLVEPGSVTRSEPLTVVFRVTDGDHSIGVHYTGLLPDLFREGQGVVAEGLLAAGDSVNADTILAKHDEKYMPKEVADALKNKGVWKGGSPQ